jgi:acetyl esterase/lipase
MGEKMIGRKPLAPAPLTPSPGTPGEGWGEGSVSIASISHSPKNPHPAVCRITGRGKFVAILLFVLSCAPLFAQTKPTTAPTVQEYSRSEVIYGRKDGMALTMDVIAPKSKHNGAGVIVVVSGGWFSSHDVIAPPFIETFGGELLRRGYTVFAVVHGSQPRYTILEILPDISRSVRFMRAHARDYEIDPKRIGICGGSAGGHLSLMQATSPIAVNPKSTDPVERETATVAAAAAFFPPTDFLNYGKQGENALGRGMLAPFKAAFDFREIDPKTKAFVQITDETRLEEIGRAISPIYHVSSTSAPTLLLHGDADTIVPIQQSQIFLAKMQEAKVPCKMIPKPGAGHGWANIQGDMSAVADWFDEYLKPPATTRP